MPVPNRIRSVRAASAPREETASAPVAPSARQAARRRTADTRPPPPDAEATATQGGRPRPGPGAATPGARPPPLGAAGEGTPTPLLVNQIDNRKTTRLHSILLF